MKIEQVICQVLRLESVENKTASSQDAVLVRVRTDTGLEGVGEADSSPEVVKAIIDAPFSHNVACGLREMLIGENPLGTLVTVGPDGLDANHIPFELLTGQGEQGVLQAQGNGAQRWHQPSKPGSGYEASGSLCRLQAASGHCRDGGLVTRSSRRAASLWKTVPVTWLRFDLRKSRI